MVRLFIMAGFAASLMAATLVAQDPAPAPDPVAVPAPAGTVGDAAPGADVAAAEAGQERPVSKAGGWYAKLKEGGTTAAVQIALSVFGAAFAFERFVNLRRKNIAPAGVSARAHQMWNEGRYDELEALGEKEPSTLTRVISFVARHREYPMSEVSVMAGDIVSQEMSVHSQRAYPLGVVATLEPLLGLLGMILGMIHTFEVVAIAGQMGDPTQLAGGISEALVTTGLGLAIAIPFLALHHYFKHKVGMFSAVLEKEITDLLSTWLMRRPAAKQAA